LVQRIIMKISFIGGGTMGEAILAALLGKGVCSPSDIQVSEPVDARREYLRLKYGVGVSASNSEAARGAEVILFAVKPQSLPEVLSQTDGSVKQTQLILSIMAGVKISTLQEGLHHTAIVRSMPNTPAQIGMGITVWVSTAEVTALQKETVRTILSVMGMQVEVRDEKTIDMATAVSGSGPAYFFLFVEALTEAAVRIGLPEDLARIMVLQTMLGSGHLLERSDQRPDQLRQMVTSRGGTTAAAIAAFEAGDFKKLVAGAVEAAYRRARELGGEKV
jgi:pyrroline-5-carboxylate reductase